MYTNLIVMFASLVGYAALVAVVINVLKFFKVIKDGDADTWNAGANLLGLVALFIFTLVRPDALVMIPGIDQNLQAVAAFLSYVFTFVVQIGVSRAAHAAIKGTPVIGTSYTLKAMRAPAMKAKTPTPM